MHAIDEAPSRIHVCVCVLYPLIILPNIAFHGVRSQERTRLKVAEAPNVIRHSLRPKHEAADHMHFRHPQSYWCDPALQHSC